MQRSKIARHPFDGDSALLTGTRDVLGGRYRREIENNFRWVEAQKAKAAIRILAPGFAEDESSWIDEAACRAAPDPEIFFPVENEDKEARAWEAYCSGCPVLEECGAYAKRLNLVGVWGGEPHGLNMGVKGRPRNFYEPGSAAERRYFRQRAQREARKAGS